MTAPAVGEPAQQWDQTQQDKIISIVLQTLQCYKLYLTPLDIVIAILKTKGKYEQVKRAMLKSHNIAKFFDAVERCDAGEKVSRHGLILDVVLRRVDAETRVIVSRLEDEALMHPILLGHAEIRSEKSSAPLLNAIVNQVNESMIVAQEEAGSDEELDQLHDVQEPSSWHDSISQTDEKSESYPMADKPAQNNDESSLGGFDSRRTQVHPPTLASREDKIVSVDDGVDKSNDTSSQEWQYQPSGIMDEFVKRLMGADQQGLLTKNPSSVPPDGDSGKAASGTVKRKHHQRSNRKRKLDEIETTFVGPSVSTAANSSFPTPFVAPLLPYRSDSTSYEQLSKLSHARTPLQMAVQSAAATGLVSVSDDSDYPPFLAPLFPTVADSLLSRDSSILPLDATSPKPPRKPRRKNNDANAKRRADVQHTNDNNQSASQGKIRPYACEHCPKRYSQLKSLRDHMHVHTGGTPYKCSAEGCGKSFVHECSFKRHKKKHLPNSIATSSLEESGSVLTNDLSAAITKTDIEPIRGTMVDKASKNGWNNRKLKSMEFVTDEDDRVSDSAATSFILPNRLTNTNSPDTGAVTSSDPFMYPVLPLELDTDFNGDHDPNDPVQIPSPPSLPDIATLTPTEDVMSQPGSSMEEYDVEGELQDKIRRKVILRVSMPTTPLESDP